jgi:hypothetical protein
LEYETIVRRIAYLDAGNIVRDLLQEWLAVWREEGDCRASERVFTPDEQGGHEDHLDRFLQTVEAELRDVPRTKPQREFARRRITSGFTEFAKGGLGLGDAHIELLLNDGFASVGTQLAREARRFDPDVSAVDIFQASRNAWTVCGLQGLMGQGMQLTPAIFAYSMLYPYTDNYLDDPAISTGAKLSFSDRLCERLKGHVVEPRNEREATIWALLDLIDEQYPREKCPEVWASLLGIHQAQENSVRMLRVGSCASDADILRFSFEKGGTSVLADAYLAAGSLTDDEARVAFGWGVLLQIVDDLQDLRQDLREGMLTIFTERATGQRNGNGAGMHLDDLTTRTLNFGRRVMQEIDCIKPSHDGIEDADPKRRCLKEMIRMSSSMLLVWSAGAADEFYTGEYLGELQRHSPFRFALLNERRKKLARWTGPLSRLFDAFLEDEENETASLLLATSLVARV